MNTVTYSNKTTVQKTFVFFIQLVLGPKVAPYLFITPFFILFLLFWVFPVGWSILLSFQKWTAVETTFVGLLNFRFVINYQAVTKAFGNIVWYVVFNNLLQIPVALFISILIDLPFLRRASGFLRGAFFLPNLVSGVSTSILFAIILGTNGLFNQLFGDGIQWMQSTIWSKPAVLIAGGWRWIGYWVVMFMAGLQGIPDEYYEAGFLDGATAWQRFRLITFPLLRPVFLFVLVVNTIGTLQIFEEPFLLLNGGGPINSSTTPIVEMYKLGFQSFDLGGAAALGWLLAILIIGVSIAQLSLAKRGGWYE